MPPARFHVRAPYFGCWILVLVYDDRKPMLEASARYSSPDPEGTLAVFQPAPRQFEVAADGGLGKETTFRPFAGTCRLAKGHISTEIVAHEMVHAACSVYRTRLGKGIALGSDCGDNEESIAYLIGQLTAGITNQLHDRGLWDA